MGAERLRRSVFCLVGALAGCGDPAPNAADEYRFQPSTLVVQGAAGTITGAWLADGGAGRVFAVVNAAHADGRPGLFVLERTGDGWGAAQPWLRPLGATAERAEWVSAWPSPSVVSIASTPAGDVVAVRTFAGAAWSAAVTVTVAGSERPSIARMAEGNARARTTTAAAPFDLVYGVATTACPNGVELRHRRSDRRTLLTPGDLPAWGAARTVATTCGLSSLSAAADGDRVIVAWTGSGLGFSGATAQDLFAVVGRGTAAVDFGAPTLLQRGANRDVSVAALGEGNGLLAWTQRALAPDGSETGLRRAAWSRFDARMSAWTRVDTGWFFTRAAPTVRGDGVATALSLGSEGDFPTSPLVLRRWRETQPVATRSVAGTPLGEVRAANFLRMSDGTVEVIWVETLPNNGPARVLWTRGVRVVSREAGV